MVHLLCSEGRSHYQEALAGAMDSRAAKYFLAEGAGRDFGNRDLPRNIPQGVETPSKEGVFIGGNYDLSPKGCDSG